MSDLIHQITADLKTQIDSFKPEYEIRDVGVVIEDGDGIARPNWVRPLLKPKGRG